MCARNNVSYKYALEWMGHRSSDILDLYYTMFDSDAHLAMATLVYPSQKQGVDAIRDQAEKNNFEKKKESR